MKKFIIFILILGIAFGAYYYWNKNKKKDKVKTVEEKTYQVKKGNISIRVSCAGQIESNLDVVIKSKASGEIIYLPFDISDKVKKGDILAKLDRDNELRNIKKDKASLDIAKARLNQAIKKYEIAKEKIEISKKNIQISIKSKQAKAKEMSIKALRKKELFDKNLSSPEDWESAHYASIQAEADYKTAEIRLEELKLEETELDVYKEDINLAKAQVSIAEVAVEDAQQRLEETIIFSPMDGVVTNRDVQIGQIISSGISNVSGGSPILTISDLNKIFVVATVDESDIGKIFLNNEVFITVDAHPKKRFKGKIVRISTKGRTVSNVVTFDVKIEIQEKNKELLKPEMTANVDIICNKKDNVILVPMEALEGRFPKVFVNVKKGKEIEKRKVVAGIDNNEFVEIKEGLKEDETLILKSSKSTSNWSRSGRMGFRMR